MITRNRTTAAALGALAFAVLSNTACGPSERSCQQLQTVNSCCQCEIYDGMYDAETEVVPCDQTDLEPETYEEYFGIALDDCRSYLSDRLMDGVAEGSGVQVSCFNPCAMRRDDSLPER
jgi:hypothetical protein